MESERWSQRGRTRVVKEREKRRVDVNPSVVLSLFQRTHRRHVLGLRALNDEPHQNWNVSYTHRLEGPQRCLQHLAENNHHSSMCVCVCVRACMCV